jgi:diketogulonate reductase-like aldo/keto reductase
LIGLGTWKISGNNKLDKSIIRAHNAKEAVSKAIKLVKRK